MPTYLLKFLKNILRGAAQRQDKSHLVSEDIVETDTTSELPYEPAEPVDQTIAASVDTEADVFELIADPHWVPSLPTTQFFETTAGKSTRRIAYTVSGNMQANKILLCLPGLLETKNSFTVLHAYFLRFSECKVISIDFSGRGESDVLAPDEQYKMSVYLSDISQFIESAILVKGNKKPRLTILGTSMGGVLAMYLAQRFRSKIYEIILNDIALTVNWTSLYSLYKSMNNATGYSEVRDLAQELSVDQRAITDVQLPTHFDLTYRADVWGMNFHAALKQFKGRVALIYGGESKICTKRRVNEAKASIPSLRVCEVPGAGHPAPFDLKVCAFIQDEMGVKG